MLKKHTNTTTDNYGCEFKYICLTTTNLYNQVVDKIYIDKHFGLQSATLRGLKLLMAKINK